MSIQLLFGNGKMIQFTGFKGFTDSRQNDGDGRVGVTVLTEFVYSHSFCSVDF